MKLKIGQPVVLSFDDCVYIGIIKSFDSYGNYEIITSLNGNTVTVKQEELHQIDNDYSFHIFNKSTDKNSLLYNRIKNIVKQVGLSNEYITTILNGISGSNISYKPNLLLMNKSIDKIIKKYTNTKCYISELYDIGISNIISESGIFLSKIQNLNSLQKDTKVLVKEIVQNENKYSAVIATKSVLVLQKIASKNSPFKTLLEEELQNNN